MHAFYNEVLPNLWLMIRMFVKTALYTGIGPGIVALIVAHKLIGYPAAATQIGRSLLAVRQFWQRLPRRIAEATNGNRVGQTRTAQRRVDDLTNAGAPWTRVEAPRVIEFPGTAGGARPRTAGIAN